MLKTSVLLALLTGLLIVIGSFFGGVKGMVIMFIVAMLMNFVSYWFSDKIVLTMYGAHEVTAEQAPDLIKMVSGLAQKGKMPIDMVTVLLS